MNDWRNGRIVLTGEKPKYREKKNFQGRFIQQKSHIE
jgi:hypothetical protein